MSAFWYALGCVFMAELGDKTQLVALCFATRFRPLIVMAAIFAATLCVHIASVAIGAFAGRVLPQDWIMFMAGLAFIGFGLWTLSGDSLDADDCDNRRGRSPFWIVATTFFFAELGDKTMVMTITLAARYSALPIWLGSTFGMVISDGLAILLGIIMNKQLPERTVKTVASLIFFGCGVYSMIEGGVKLPLYAWGIGAAVLAVMIAFFLKSSREGEKGIRTSASSELQDAVPVGAAAKKDAEN